jgi:hypothetical protein
MLDTIKVNSKKILLNCTFLMNKKREDAREGKLQRYD